jgi:hemerythrin-like domain-containing protein
MAPRSGNVRTIFLEDHARLERLFVALREAFEAGDHDATRALWTELDEGLATHMRGEERYLFPDLAKSAADEVEALRREHDALRTQIAELGVAVDLRMVSAAMANAFIERLHAHAAREDALLYRWADEHLAGEPRAALLSDVARANEEGANAGRGRGERSGAASAPAGGATTVRP